MHDNVQDTVQDNVQDNEQDNNQKTSALNKLHFWGTFKIACKMTFVRKNCYLNVKLKYQNVHLFLLHVDCQTSTFKSM